MGVILIPEKLSIPDSKILNLTMIPEASVKNVLPKVYTESYVKRANYINLDPDHEFKFRSDFVIGDKPTTIELSGFALYGTNEIKSIVQLAPYTLDIDVHNNIKKFVLEIGIYDKSSNIDFKLAKLVQPHNHDKFMLSRPELTIYDMLDKTELLKKPTNSTKLFIRNTRNTLNIYDESMQLLYSYGLLAGKHLYFKLLSDANSQLQSDLILTRKAL